MDKITIKNLEIFAFHGVLESEKEMGQRFFVNAELFLNLRDAGMTDELDKTVDYSMVCKDIKEVMTASKYDLIEAVAWNISSTILAKYAEIKKVHISISKPDAPIPMKFETVCVDITTERHTVYLSIGSNIGDREAYLDYAVDQLNKDEYIKVNKVSDYINTKPYGGVEQDDFLNGCLEIETIYDPFELLAVIHDIEQGAGRKRLVHWGPRTLDIDILMYDREIIMEENLMIPHPEMTKRDFVLEPLCRIAPYAYHPGCNKTVSMLYEELKNQNI